MSVKLKKIIFKKNNFYYYFNIIFKFRNNLDYLKLNKIKKVSKKDSHHWLLDNKDKRIFFLIKFNNKNVGIFNFNKMQPTFSQVILKKYRNKKIGKISAKILLKKLKKMGYYRLTTFASKNNLASYNIHKEISFKSKLLTKKNNFYQFFINTKKF